MEIAFNTWVKVVRKGGLKGDVEKNNFATGLEGLLNYGYEMLFELVQEYPTHWEVPNVKASLDAVGICTTGAVLLIGPDEYRWTV